MKKLFAVDIVRRSRRKYSITFHDVKYMEAQKNGDVNDDEKFIISWFSIQSYTDLKIKQDNLMCTSQPRVMPHT